MGFLKTVKTLRLFASLALLSGVLVLAATAPAHAEWVNPQNAYDYSREIVDAALQNPAVARTGYRAQLMRLAELLPLQKFGAISRYSWGYRDSCFGASAVDGHWTEHSGFTDLGSCITRWDNYGHTQISCRIGICPRGMNESQAATAHVILHEMGHVIGGGECESTGLAMLAFRLAGLSAYRDAYVEPCGLGWLETWTP